MRVAFYYGAGTRLPAADSNNNPYGNIIASGLERRGVEVEFVNDYTEEFLRQNRDRFDVLHHHWPHHSYFHPDHVTMTERMRGFVRYMELARELGYKLVWTAHNIYPHNRTHQDIDHLCRLELCRLATAILAHCEVAAEAVRATFGRRGGIFLAPHPHFIGIYPELHTRESARAELGVPANAFAYGFFASIQRYKGVEELIDAAKRLPEDTWLLVSGGNRREPEYLETIRRLAGDHPRIVLRTYPRAPSEDISLIMKACDAVTLPFVDTTTSGSLILGLSWGRPAIAPALGCLPSTVDPEAGILYDPKRPDALFEAMLRIREWDITAAWEAARRCAGHFDWEEIADVTLRAYRA